MTDIFHEHMTLSETAKTGPQARKVIEKYFGKDCFACPGFAAEPLFLGARMHAVNLDHLLAELNGIK